MKNFPFWLRMKLLFRNYPTDNELCRRLIGLLKSDILSIEKDNYYVTINFENGRTLIFWNVNKYHAWISRGEIYANNKRIFVWNNSMPTKKIMYLMYLKINEFDLGDNERHNLTEKMIRAYCEDRMEDEQKFSDQLHKLGYYDDIII